jgi:hypothetical protein
MAQLILIVINLILAVLCYTYNKILFFGINMFLIGFNLAEFIARCKQDGFKKTIENVF